MKRDFLNTLKGITLGLVLMGGVVGVYAASWTAPTQAPPNGNVAAPLNVGSAAQVKAGSLGLATPGNPTAALDVNGQIRMRGGSPANGKLLVSDTGGTATWKHPEVTHFTYSVSASHLEQGRNVDGVNTHDMCFMGRFDMYVSDGKHSECKIKDTNGNKVWRFNVISHDGPTTCYATCVDW